jgi:hypothetical protein
VGLTTTGALVFTLEAVCDEEGDPGNETLEFSTTCFRGFRFAGKERLDDMLLGRISIWSLEHLRDRLLKDDKLVSIDCTGDSG